MTEYIKREDVIALAWDVTYKDEWHMHRRDTVVSVSDIAEIPSADVVERKKGEWFDRGSLSCRCSNCGCKANKEYSFCPNCGADMRGRKDAKDN